MRPWSSTNMARTRGRAPRGERLRAAISHGHSKSTTFVAGLRKRGMVAPMVLDGPNNCSAFQAYVDQLLVPDLRPGDVVVMDNLSNHKRPGIRAAIEAACANLLYLPPYSHDFNPIENAFAKLKAMLREAAERILEGLWSATVSVGAAPGPVQTAVRPMIVPVATRSISSAMVAWPVIAKGSRLACLEYLSSSEGFTALASTCPMVQLPKRRSVISS